MLTHSLAADGRATVRPEEPEICGADRGRRKVHHSHSSKQQIKADWRNELDSKVPPDGALRPDGVRSSHQSPTSVQPPTAEVGAPQSVFGWMSGGASPLLRSFAVMELPQNYHTTTIWLHHHFPPRGAADTRFPRNPTYPPPPRTPGHPRIKQRCGDPNSRVGLRTWNMDFSLLLGGRY